MKLVALFTVLVLFLSECWCLYPKRPTISISAIGYGEIVSEEGDYAPDYTVDTRDVTDAWLYVIDDPYFGCAGYESNITNTLPSRSAKFALMLPSLGSNSPCPEFSKAIQASRLGASGLIFQYDRSDVQGGWLGKRPSQAHKLSGMNVVVVEILNSRLAPLVYQPGVDTTATVSITGHFTQFQTSQTFYFIVFAFCILMLLSCLWFVMSYIKRCHYNVQRRRRRIRTANETRRAVNRLPVKSFKAVKNSEDPTCAVCLETFHNNDAIRVLPCKHEFHKKCVDPWLKIKQNCPMCKCSITSAPSSGTPLRELAADSVADEAEDFSVINLREEEEDIGSPEHLGEADVVSNTSNAASDTSSEPASDSPLLTSPQEPTVEIMLYSPQVEVNLGSLLPGEVGDH